MSPEISRIVNVKEFGWGEWGGPFRMATFLRNSVRNVDLFMLHGVNITINADKNVRCSNKKINKRFIQIEREKKEAKRIEFVAPSTT